MLDEFLWGRVTRISPEAPVPVVEVERESHYAGGAANVARNLRSLGAQVAVLGRTGADDAGYHLLRLLTEDGIDVSGVLREPDYPTTIKTRIVARQQQVVRVDREVVRPLTGESLRRLRARLAAVLPRAQAVVVSDYGKGLLQATLAEDLCRLAQPAGVRVLVDPNPHNPLRWPNVTAIKPNRREALEAARALGLASAALTSEDWPAIGEFLRAQWSAEMILVTLGEEGMLLFQEGQRPLPVPTRAREVFDVSGAGDTAMAAFAVALCTGATPAEAAELATLASGIAVGKLGTAAVSAAELPVG